MKHTESQLEAISSIYGPVCVVSVPGSGKTHIIVHRAKRMIESGVDPKNIVLITFANESANEMKERIAKLVGEEKVNNMFVGTIHSFCNYVIRSVGFDDYEIADSIAKIKEIAFKRFDSKGFDFIEASDKSIEVAFKFDKIKVALSEIHTKFKSSEEEHKVKIGDKTYIIGSDALNEIIDNTIEELNSLGIITFDLMLKHFLSIMKSNQRFRNAVHKRFKFIFVDEYQDVSPIQANIIDILAETEKNICVVGDVDQSIYSFRGADPSFMLTFKERYPNAKIIYNNVSFRFGENIASFAQELINNNKNRFKDEYIDTVVNIKGKTYIDSYNTKKDMLSGVADIIEERLKINENESIAVLSRSKYLLKDICNVFKKRDIPFRDDYGNPTYSSFTYTGYKLIKAIDYNSYKRGGRKSISISNNYFISFLNKIKIGIGKVTKTGLKSLASRLDISLIDYISNIISGDVDKDDNLLREVLSKKTYKKLKSISVDILEMVKDYSEASNIRRTYQLLESLDIANRKMSLKDFMREFLLIADKNKIESKKVSNHGVHTLTIHRAKGREYDIVFVIGIKDLKRIGNSFGDVSVTDTNVDREEERRVAYVGITRAMKEVYVTYNRVEFSKDKNVFIPYSNEPKIISELKKHKNAKIRKIEEDHSPLMSVYNI